ncbi:MAG: hypothetical protein ACK5JP_07720 [Akkermansiaceae bacterium]|jgi:predicted lysophospholipase L1 biosynthesis ABC-type transport system permease subunit
MTYTVEMVSIGDSEGILLSEELMEKLNVSVGDSFAITEIPNGLLLKPCDPELAD